MKFECLVERNPSDQMKFEYLRDKAECLEGNPSDLEDRNPSDLEERNPSD